MPDPTPDQPASEERTPIRVTALEVGAHRGQSKEIELLVVAVPAGKGVMAVSTATGERLRRPSQAGWTSWSPMAAAASSRLVRAWGY